MSVINSRSLYKLVHPSVIPSKHLILCHPLLFPLSIFLSIGIFSNKSVLHIRWPKCWSFSFSISPSNEYSGTDFLYDWLVGSFCSPRDSQESSPTTQFKSINSSALSFPYSPQPYVTTGKTTALTRWTLLGKVISLLFNMLSRLVIAFLPRSKHLLILWLQSWSAVILEPKQIVCHCFHCFPFYLPWSDGTRCNDFSFLNVEF